MDVEKLVEVEKTVEVEKVVEVTKPCEKCSESCKDCDEKDKKIADLGKIKKDLLSDVKYVKESYDVLNRTVDSLKRTNAEFEKANDKMSATLMTKQGVINDYIEDYANLKKELELERIESVRIRRLLLSYTTCDYLIDRVYLTVAGLEAFKKKEKEEDTGKKTNVKYNRCPFPIFESYSPRKPIDETIKLIVIVVVKKRSSKGEPPKVEPSSLC